MKRNKNIHFLKMDFYRAVCSRRFTIGIIGIPIMMQLASIETFRWRLSVLNTFWLVVYSLPFLLTLIFCAFIYADSLCEDFEYKFIYAEIIRGNLCRYAMSKTITIFLTSVVAMALGMVLFAITLRLQVPWISLSESTYQVAITEGGFREILESEHYLAYFGLFGVQFGLLAGVLSLLAAYVSLYISNKLLVLSVPVVAYYLLVYFENGISGSPYLNIGCIFDASNNLWRNDAFSFLYAVAIAVVFGLILSFLIYRRLNRRIRNE